MEKDFQKWLKPVGNLVVRNPRNMSPLPPSGGWCDWTGPEGRYWRKCVRQGVVSIVDIKKQPPIKTLVEDRKKRKREE